MTGKKKQTRTKARAKTVSKPRAAKTMKARTVAVKASTHYKTDKFIKVSDVPNKAKIFMTGRSQAVRLPKEFRFEGEEVFIERDGDKVILSPKPGSWVYFFNQVPAVTDDFMETREDLPVQERKLFD